MYTAKLTDPAKHDPDNFIYLVHGVMDYQQLSSNTSNPSANIIKSLKRIRDSEDFYSASLVGKLTASRAKETTDWCGGELSQLATFGRFGFILEPKDLDIWIAWNCDLGTPHDQEKRREFANKYRGRRKDVLDLLANPIGMSDGVNFNELVINGNQNTNIAGVFYKTTNKKTETEGKNLAQIAMDLLGKQLPVVVLHETIKLKEYDGDPKTQELQRELEGMRDILALQMSVREFREGKDSGFKIRDGKYHYNCEKEILKKYFN
jgi:hypothetical protein